MDLVSYPWWRTRDVLCPSIDVGPRSWVSGVGVPTRLVRDKSERTTSLESREVVGREVPETGPTRGLFVWEVEDSKSRPVVTVEESYLRTCKIIIQ